MMLPDVNVLIYAFRPDSANHQVCRNWLDSVVNGDALYGMSPQVCSSVIRVVTNPRIWRQPDPLEKAVAFANTLLHRPNCQIVHPGARHWGIFCDLCRGANATGNLIADAWFAALAIESGCEWITFDRDYSRFERLRWRLPF